MKSWIIVFYMALLICDFTIAVASLAPFFIKDNIPEASNSSGDLLNQDFRQDKDDINDFKPQEVLHGDKRGKHNHDTNMHLMTTPVKHDTIPSENESIGGGSIGAGYIENRNKNPWSSSEYGTSEQFQVNDHAKSGVFTNHSHRG